MQNLIKVLPVLPWPLAICFTKPLNQQKKCVNKYSSFAWQPCQVSLVCVEGAEQSVAEATGYVLHVLCSCPLAISQFFGKCNREICIKELF